MCPVCGSKNEKGKESCEHCGSDLMGSTADESENEVKDTQETISGFFDEELGEPKPYLGFDPDEDLGGATVKEVSEFVRTNTLYYLPVFKRMKDIGSKLSFNLTCLFFPSLYFANRKMWSWAVLAVFLNVIFGIPGALIYMLDTDALIDYPSIVTLIENNRAFLEGLEMICNAADVFVKLLFCLFGNRIYFKYIVRSMKRIKSSGTTFMAQRINSMGGVNPTNMIVITLIKVGVALFIVMTGFYIYDVMTAGKDSGAASLFFNFMQ